jgi:hypothetical protein
MLTNSASARASSPAPGSLNLRLAWWLIGAGLASGAVLGLWSFGGPLAAPAGFTRPDELPRRLVRLAHIALVALPALNVLYVPSIRGSAWSARTQRLACRLLLFGTVALPACLALAAFAGAAVYLAALPVVSLIVAVFLLASKALPEREVRP